MANIRICSAFASLRLCGWSGLVSVTLAGIAGSALASEDSGTLGPVEVVQEPENSGQPQVKFFCQGELLRTSWAEITLSSPLGNTIAGSLDAANAKKKIALAFAFSGTLEKEDKSGDSPATITKTYAIAGPGESSDGGQSEAGQLTVIQGFEYNPPPEGCLRCSGRYSAVYSFVLTAADESWSGSCSKIAADSL